MRLLLLTYPYVKQHACLASEEEYVGPEFCTLPVAAPREKPIELNRTIRIR
jgi:hypothetical protein